MELFLFKTNIIRYYLLPNSTALKLCKEKCEYVTAHK